MSLELAQSCTLEAPSLLPLMTKRHKLEGLCAKIVLTESADSAFGGGIDVKFPTTELASIFVDTVATLIAHLNAHKS